MHPAENCVLHVIISRRYSERDSRWQSLRATVLSQRKGKKVIEPVVAENR